MKTAIESREQSNFNVKALEEELIKTSKFFKDVLSYIDEAIRKSEYSAYIYLKEYEENEVLDTIKVLLFHSYKVKYFSQEINTQDYSNPIQPIEWKYLPSIENTYGLYIEISW